MKDIDFMQLDDLLYNQLIEQFNLNLEEEDLKIYFEFRNKVVDFIDEILNYSGS
jgi:hypothetical protein